MRDGTGYLQTVLSGQVVCRVLLLKTPKKKKSLTIFIWWLSFQLGTDISSSYINFRIIRRSRWNFTGYTWRQISTGRSWANCWLLECSGYFPRRQRCFYQQIKRGILTVSCILVLYFDTTFSIEIWSIDPGWSSPSRSSRWNGIQRSPSSFSYALRVPRSIRVGEHHRGYTPMPRPNSSRGRGNFVQARLLRRASFPHSDLSAIPGNLPSQSWRRLLYSGEF